MIADTDQPSATLPSIVRAWFAAHEAQQVEAELATMTDDVIVVDQNRAYRGRQAVRSWISGASREYDYTTTVLDTGSDGDATVVTARLEGDFPGGLANLIYRFLLSGDRISRLTISS